jgi:hypothetical protein
VGKEAGAWGWRTHHFHVPNVTEIWELKPPGTLWATPGLLRDCFTFTFLPGIRNKFQGWEVVDYVCAYLVSKSGIFIFCDFPQYLQKNSGVLPQVGSRLLHCMQSSVHC